MIIDWWPLPATIVAKAVTWAAFINGFTAHQATATHMKAYGVDKSNALADVFEQYFGALLMCVGAAGICLFHGNTSTETAIGWIGAIMVFENTRALLLENDRKAGLSPSIRRYVWTPLSFVVMLANFVQFPFQDQEYYSVLVTKAAGSILAAANVPIAFSPAFGSPLYGYEYNEKKLAVITKTCIRHVGWQFGCVGVLVVMLASKVEPTRAFGLAWLFQFGNFFSLMFVTREVDQLKISKAPMYFWLCFHTAAIISLLN